jgi:hypothetical protein
MRRVIAACRLCPCPNVEFGYLLLKERVLKERGQEERVLCAVER